MGKVLRRPYRCLFVYKGKLTPGWEYDGHRWLFDGTKISHDPVVRNEAEPDLDVDSKLKYRLCIPIHPYAKEQFDPGVFVARGHNTDYLNILIEPPVNNSYQNFEPERSFYIQVYT